MEECNQTTQQGLPIVVINKDPFQMSAAVTQPDKKVAPFSTTDGHLALYLEEVRVVTTTLRHAMDELTAKVRYLKARAGKIIFNLVATLELSLNYLYN